MTRARTRTGERELMRRMPWRLMLCVLVLGAALAGCDGPNRGSNTQPSAASGLILDLVASPNVVPGARAGSPAAPMVGGCSLVQAKVSNTQGQLVDGVPVLFATTLCCFTDTPTSAAAFSQTETTTRGTATVRFCGTTDRGTSTITASVEDAFDTVLVTVF
jgi:hypothetical protein